MNRFLPRRDTHPIGTERENSKYLYQNSPLRNSDKTFSLRTLGLCGEIVFSQNCCDLKYKPGTYNGLRSAAVDGLITYLNPPPAVIYRLLQKNYR